MFDSIKNIWHPELYHGFNKKNNFFEGWYFKNIGEDGTSVLSVIPGIFKSKDKTKEHAFIQFIDGITKESHYIRFEAEQFIADKNQFSVQIGNCTFDENRIFIDIDQPGFRAFGELNFKELTKWDTSFLSPGIMDWYSFMPFMECNHGIVSMNHRVRGKILINKNVYLFTFGRGYIEKDWGSSFPSSYIWMQSNNFSNTDVSFFCSIARIPWFGSHFRGYICFVLIEGKIYKFATYTGAKLLELKIVEDTISYKLSDKHYDLFVEAHRTNGAMLLAPYNNQMVEGRVHETLLSEINIRLINKTLKGNITVFEGKSQFSGLEIVGNLQEIL
jgi:hypothetical protein